MPGLVGGFTVTLVTMIGASAMAVGAGGLGDAAVRHGHQRSDTTVMLSGIAILIALVCLVPGIGAFAVRRLEAR